MSVQAELPSTFGDDGAAAAPLGAEAAKEEPAVDLSLMLGLLMGPQGLGPLPGQGPGNTSGQSSQHADCEWPRHARQHHTSSQQSARPF